jgi:hypothetical protein
MFILDSLFIDGLRFVMDKLITVAEAELQDDTVIRERLLDAQMRLELGELTEEEFADIERDVFDRLRELKGAQPAGLSMISSGDARVISVEASVADELDTAAGAESAGAGDAADIAQKAPRPRKRRPRK